MGQDAPPVSGEGKAVIAELIARLRDDEQFRLRRWPNNPVHCEWIRKEASEGRLYVPAGFWFHSVLLDAEGRVVVLTGDPEIARPANAIEAHIVWQESVARAWPELATFVPSRPDDALTCRVCGGTGRPPYATGALSNVMCECGNTGWIPVEADGLAWFDDWPPSGAAAPSRPTSIWQRLVAWFAAPR
jgi:hypothetical protein